ncbi:MAG: hypothetical protein Ta2B_08420 [Termitinemataceae bacterium]|nr:MAG: hypothetical protein Ta2B_08420 [Termitinemataceae bacterium]
MKSISRLIAFFGLFFTFIFLVAIGTGFLRIWLQAVSTVPITRNLILSDVIDKLEWALPFTLYISIIFSVNYAKRHKANGIVAFFTVVALSAVFSWGIAKGMDNARNMASPAFLIERQTLGKEGLILSQGKTVFTLLDTPSLQTGSRVISLPGDPLIYQELPIGSEGNIIKLPPIPFNRDSLSNTSVHYDLMQSGRHLSSRYSEGTFSFCVWVIALILLLSAFSIIFEIGEWHLANIISGLLIFRGILAFEVFINSETIQDYLYGFFRGAVSIQFVTPIIFMLIAILVLIYIILYHLALEKKGETR